MRTSATGLIEVSGEVVQQVCRGNELRVVKIHRDTGEFPGAASFHAGALAVQPFATFAAETRNALREELE